MKYGNEPHIHQLQVQREVAWEKMVTDLRERLETPTAVGHCFDQGWIDETMYPTLSGIAQVNAYLEQYPSTQKLFDEDIAAWGQQGYTRYLVRMRIIIWRINKTPVWKRE